MNPTAIPLDQLRRDGGTQSRDGLNDKHVAELVEAIELGAELPPVTVFYDGADYWLADGFHRVAAAERLEHEAIAADVRQGTQDAAADYACGANRNHGLRRTNADKRRAVESMLRRHTDWSDSRVAEHVGVDHKTVASVRATWEIPKSTTRTGSDGRIVNTAKIGKSAGPPRETEPPFDLAAALDAADAEYLGLPDECDAATVSAAFDRMMVARDAAIARAGGKKCPFCTQMIAPADWGRYGCASCEALGYTPRDIRPAEPPPVSERADYDGDSWGTPADLIGAARAALGAIDLDPASNESAQRTVQATQFYTAEHDGLAQPWAGRVWLNPPYSQPLLDRFVAKLVDEYDAGHVAAALLLVNNATETRWFQALLKRFPVCFLAGRVAFVYGGEPRAGTRQGQALFYVGPDDTPFRRAFAERGTILEAE